MRRHKAVTNKKIDANRNNSKHSTGPRTERGKRVSKFNAVTLGIFAKHVVIATCDGENSEKEFRSLLSNFHEEFQPVGTFEEWLVLKVAECTWRLRRATRSENGAVRTSVIWAKHPDDERWEEHLLRKIAVLTEAEDQLREVGTLAHLRSTISACNCSLVLASSAVRARTMVSTSS